KLSKSLTSKQIAEINGLMEMHGSKPRVDVSGRLAKIQEYGAELSFAGLQPNDKGQQIFAENLVLVDSLMPEILSWLLLKSYTSGEKKLEVLTRMITEENPMKFSMTVNKNHYEAKIKRLLMDFALGMLPSQPYNAQDLASGILVVKSSGEIDCYHVLYRETLQEYLFHDLKFETPSASRHNYACIREDDQGNQYIALNLQLRFIV
ncbi:MAG: HpaII family restriction endonuclease, partial [Lachnospiraceae bacterium]|nr:HpaII family restriction endonuclease [Lachnospiraceae bacterium]